MHALGMSESLLARTVFLCVLSILALGSVNASALNSTSTHLYLVGGGELPNEAIGRLGKYAGGAKGNVLVITWANDSPPEEGAQWIGSCLKEALPGNAPVAVPALTVAQVLADKASFLKQLAAATGVFFTGGDQADIMNLLEAQPDIVDMFRARFESGIPFGGTSAGMAIMSKEMFTGGEDPKIIDPKQPKLFRPGLGLISGVMVDTHFLVRGRENRFFSYLLGHDVPIGLGIDQDGVVEVTDGQLAEVIGNKQVMLADTVEHPGDLLVKILKPGDTFDLVRRKKLGEGTPHVASLCSARK